jgi:hypothetical protein
VSGDSRIAKGPEPRLARALDLNRALMFSESGLLEAWRRIEKRAKEIQELNRASRSS